MTGSFEVIHKNLTDGLKLLFSNSSQYARELNTVDYLANLISSLKPLKSELQFNQDLTNLLNKFSNEATPCVQDIDFSSNSVESLLHQHFDEISY